MTDRARLTVERVEQIREYALAGKVDTILVQEQECVALCDHALAALRRESAAPDEPSEADLDRGCANATERMEAIKAKRAAPDGGLSGERIAELRARGKSCGLLESEVDALCDTALRSLERPACRVVPEEATEEMLIAGWRVQGNDFSHSTPPPVWSSAIKKLWKAMLAASPPAATEGWVRVEERLPEAGEQVVARRWNGTWDRSECNPIYFDGLPAWYLPEGPTPSGKDGVTHWMPLPTAPTASKPPAEGTPRDTELDDFIKVARTFSDEHYQNALIAELRRVYHVAQAERQRCEGLEKERDEAVKRMKQGWIRVTDTILPETLRRAEQAESRAASAVVLLRQMCAEYQGVCKRAGHDAEHNYGYREARKLLDAASGEAG